MPRQNFLNFLSRERRLVHSNRNARSSRHHPHINSAEVTDRSPHHSLHKKLACNLPTFVLP